MGGSFGKSEAQGIVSKVDDNTVKRGTTELTVKEGTEEIFPYHRIIHQKINPSSWDTDRIRGWDGTKIPNLQLPICGSRSMAAIGS